MLSAFVFLTHIADPPSLACIASQGVEPLEGDYSLFAKGFDGTVLAAQGADLVRLLEGGQRYERLYHFDEPIAGIHTSSDGLVLVSTTTDHWNPMATCRVFLSRDSGRSFELTKEIDRPGGCPIAWSLASGLDGSLYMGEYGPKQGDMSKRVWRSKDQGRSWQPVFHAPKNDHAHIHRVAVDPFTGYLWVTVGDSKRNRGTFRSMNGGDSWSLVRDSQATGVAFVADGIYWGEDEETGKISYSRRSDNQADTVLTVSDHGKFGGSVYDLAVGRDGRIYAPFMKYADQDRTATVWAGTGRHWRLLLCVPTPRGAAAAISTIAGPDRDGWLYVRGYRIRDGS